MKRIDWASFLMDFTILLIAAYTHTWWILLLMFLTSYVTGDK